MVPRSQEPLLVGVDGGASEVRACAVDAAGGVLTAAANRSSFSHAPVAGFAPAPLEIQLAAREAGAVGVGEPERAQGESWIETYALAIESVAARAGSARLLVGVCAPGLKTPDGRGLAVVRHGPRIPDFLARLEARLARGGIVLERPIPPLLSDGVASGLGERAAHQGGFSGVASAYYLGGGTGLAECCLLAGRIVALDELEGVCVKAWSLASSSGRDYESHLSARGLRARFVALGGRADAWPEAAFRERDPAARRAFEECAALLAELVNRRVDELRAGRGVELERAVVGQRLGLLLADPDLRAVLREPAERGARVPLVASRLREAAALGAARWALDAAGGAQPEEGLRGR